MKADVSLEYFGRNDDEMRELLHNLLMLGYEVLLASDGTEGLAVAKETRPDLVLSDMVMSGPMAALEGFIAGADDCIEKPFHLRVLLARLAAHFKRRASMLPVTSQTRFAAIGTLAAGVGHEVRNPVNGVLNGVRTLLPNGAASGA